MQYHAGQFWHSSHSRTTNEYEVSSFHCPLFCGVRMIRPQNALILFFIDCTLLPLIWLFVILSALINSLLVAVVCLSILCTDLGMMTDRSLFLRGYKSSQYQCKNIMIFPFIFYTVFLIQRCGNVHVKRLQFYKQLRCEQEQFSPPGSCLICCGIPVSNGKKVKATCYLFCCFLFSTQPLNLGLGHGISVLEFVKEFERLTKVHIPYEFAGRRLGDVATLVCDGSRGMKELKWQPRRSFQVMCKYRCSQLFLIYPFISGFHHYWGPFRYYIETYAQTFFTDIQPGYRAGSFSVATCQGF